jgi:hypothetical protein
MEIARYAFALLAAAVVGILADWLIKLRLPANPRKSHIIAGIIAIITLTIISSILFVSQQNKKEESIILNKLEIETIFPFFIGSKWIYNYGNTTSESIAEAAQTTALVSEYSEEVVNIQTGLSDKVKIIEAKINGEYFLNPCANNTSSYSSIWYVIDNNHLFQTCSQYDANKLATTIVHKEQIDPRILPIYLAPMKLGLLWNAFPDIAPRSDTPYQWYIEALVDIEVPAGKYKDCYRLLLFTNPDTTIKWICNGIGLVAWEYNHHGSIINYRAELKEFHKYK